METEGSYVVMDFGLVSEMGSQYLTVEFHEEFVRLLLSMVLDKQVASCCCIVAVAGSSLTRLF